VGFSALTAPAPPQTRTCPLSVLQRFFGSSNDRKVKALMARVAKINALEPSIQALTDAELEGENPEFEDRLAKGDNPG
jgi:preprotein translocase subunit SecA